MSNNGPAPAPPALSDLLWDRYARLLGVKRRIYVLRAFFDELATVARKKHFQVRNDIVWNMTLDARDKCVIDLYSLTVEMRHGMKPLDPSLTTTPGGGKRGLFRLVMDHHRASLTRTYLRNSGDNDDEFNLGTKERAALFAGLFPGCSTESPSPQDVELLCERFRLAMVPLGKDRNKNRAHVHEGDFGTVPMQSIEQLEKLFDFCETLLEDLSLASGGPSFVTTNMNRSHCPSTAADLADLVLFGNSREIARLQKGRTRDALLARLHEIDDLRQGEGATEKLCFNQRQFDPTFDGFADVT